MSSLQLDAALLYAGFVGFRQLCTPGPASRNCHWIMIFLLHSLLPSPGGFYSVCRLLLMQRFCCRKAVHRGPNQSSIKAG